MKQKAKLIAKKIIKYVLESVAIVIALAAVIVIAGVWRLSYAPLPLNFFKPFVEEALAESQLGVRVSFEDSMIQWSDKSSSLQLVLTNIEIANDHNLKLGHIESLGFGLSLRALVYGDLRVRDLILYQPDFYLLRNEKGEVHLDFQKEDKKEKLKGKETVSLEQDLRLTSILQQLATPYQVSKKNSFLNYLNSVSVVDAEVRFLDLATQQFWRFPKVNFTFAKIEQGFGGKLDFDLESDEKVMHFDTKLSYKLPEKKAEAGQIYWSLDAERFYIRDFIKRFKQLSVFDGTTLPVNLHTEVLFSDTLDLLSFDVKATAQQGNLKIDNVLQDVVEVKSFDMEARYDDETGVAQVKQAKLTLNEALFDVTASWDLNQTKDNFLIESSFSGFSTDELFRVWPMMAAPNAREWAVSNISKGGVKKGDLTFKASIDLSADEAMFGIDDFSGGFDYEGLQVQFQPDMSPVTELTGRATFSLSDLSFGIDFAMVNDLLVGGGHVKIHNFDYDLGPIEILDIDLKDISGDVKNLATLLDQNPLNILSKVNRKAEDFGGEFKGDVFLSFPLSQELKIEEIIFKGKAHSDSLVLKNVYQDLLLEKGSVDVTVDQQALNVKGSGLVGGARLSSIEVMEDISGNNKVRTKVNFKGLVPIKMVSKFSIPLDDYLTGHAELNFKYIDNRNGGQTIDIKGDLNQTHIDLKSLINYKKESGTPINASLSLHLDSNSELTKISPMRLWNKDKSVDVDGAMFFSKGSQLSRLEFPKFKVEKNDIVLKGERHKTEKNRLKLDISGNTVDIRGFLESDDDPISGGDANSASFETGKSDLAYEIGINVDRAVAVDETLFEQVNGYILRDREPSIQVFELDMFIPSDNKSEQPPITPTVRVRYTPNKLTAFSNEAGGLIKRLGIYDDLEGGDLYIKLLPQSDNVQVMEGQLLCKGLHAIEAPVIARILDGLSFEGISSLLEGENKGLHFNRIASNVVWDKTLGKEMLKLREGKTKSESLGLTFDGNYYFTTGKTEISGTIVPARGVNNFIASIPLLGDIITLGTSDSIFAATYSVKKKPEDKDVSVSVNPIAALAPGFLRTLFFEERFDEDTFNDQ